MLTTEQLIDLLNQDLMREYKATIMYRQHAAVLSGVYFAFVDTLYEHANDEISHAKLLAEHINLLGGYPVATAAQSDIAFENIPMLELDYLGEQEAIDRYKERIGQCLEMSDYGTQAILLEILQDEESHKNDIASILEGIHVY